MSKPLVVNLFGAPSSGKSTTAAYVFSLLKMAGVNAELVTEFAKDKTWERNTTALANQVYMLGKQYYRLSRCEDQVECIVTDSPLPLNIFYNKDPILGEDYNRVVMNLFEQYENMNYFLSRVKPYNPAGRNQTESESDALCPQLQELLRKHGVVYQELPGNGQSGDKIYKEVLCRIEELRKGAERK